MKGKFIAFEGCEGSGKSTQLKLLAEYLIGHGVDFILTREPGGSEISEQIRGIILNGKNTDMCDECEALLYAAARVQHLKQTVMPALEDGKLVICDRYIYSSLAYQGYARGLGVEFVESVNAYALEHCPADMTVFLDISPVDAFERKHGADENDRMEQQGLDFHNRVYGGYLALAEKYPRICRIDCGGTKYETNAKITALLKSRGFI